MSIWSSWSPPHQKTLPSLSPFRDGWNWAMLFLRRRGTLTETAVPGRELSFRWTAQTYVPGVLTGVLWVSHLDDQGDWYALYARPFTLTTTKFLGIFPLSGFPGWQARAWGWESF